MGQQQSGLTKRGGVWHIDKRVGGVRICESTGTGDVAKAQEVLAKRVNDLREARLYGLREDHTFRAAATKYLMEYQHKKSIGDDAMHLKALDPFIGSCALKQVHMGSLQAFIAKRRQDGVKTKTVNAALGVVRRVLNLAASEWMDEQGMTWLATAPKIKLFAVTDARSPYPLTDEEQALLFQELPDHLARMALFKVNTGLREQEVCRLRWDWEVKVPELETSVFVIPGERVKNGEERLVVLNWVASR
jgi:integrase